MILSFADRFALKLRDTPLSLQAKVTKDGESVVDVGQRPAKIRTVSPSTASLISQRFQEVTDLLVRHFQQSFQGFESPQFLIYQTGDFHVPHRDVSENSQDPDYVRDRKISAVLYLNRAGESRDDSSFEGGELTLYGLLDDSRAKKYGFSIIGEEGLLVTFKANLVHEVTPVTHGARYSIVSHFF